MSGFVPVGSEQVVTGLDDHTSDSAGTRKVVAPLWTGTSGSVTAMTMKNDALRALDVQYFSP